MRRILCLFLFSCFLIAAAYASDQHGGEGQHGNHEAHDNGENGHVEHAVEKSAQVTIWSDRFEIFLEHKFIVVNKPTRFITHITNIKTLEPRREGPVTFILSHGNETPIKQIEPQPARDGIYILKCCAKFSLMFSTPDVIRRLGPGQK